jgi:hypothetical protein
MFRKGKIMATFSGIVTLKFTNNSAVEEDSEEDLIKSLEGRNAIRDLVYLMDENPSSVNVVQFSVDNFDNNDDIEEEEEEE